MKSKSLLVDMKNDNFPREIRIGSEYIKLKNGNVAPWESFDEKNQVFEFRSPTGEISKVHRRDIETPTEAEVVDSLSSKRRASN